MSSFARASLWMALWISCTLSMTLAGRELSKELPVAEIMALRSFMAALAITPAVLWSGGTVFRTQYPGLHFTRNVAHFAAQFFWFLAVALIPLAQVVAIEFTMPIWTALLAAALLGERLTGNRILAIGLGFAGVLVILRPGVAAVSPGAFSALAAALGFSLSVTLVKKLTASEGVLTILAHMFWTQAALSIVLIFTLASLPDNLFSWVWPSPHLYPFIALMGVVGSAGHYCLTRATSAVDATVIGPLDFMRVPLTALMGFALYAEPLTIYLLLGALLILAGNSMNRNRRAAEL
ncbi:MAG TPA: DMT family transporter [Aestuariivirgaceae bacterium]|jgi:drug/metabolite transporter (DMT)-like permease